MEEKLNNYNLYISFGIESPEYLGTLLNVTEAVNINKEDI